MLASPWMRLKWKSESVWFQFEHLGLLASIRLEVVDQNGGFYWSTTTSRISCSDPI
jgi:hypothetical protein